MDSGTVELLDASARSSKGGEAACVVTLNGQRQEDEAEAHWTEMDIGRAYWNCSGVRLLHSSKDFGATALRSATQRLCWAFSTLEPPDSPEEFDNLANWLPWASQSISHGAIIGDFWDRQFSLWVSAMGCVFLRLLVLSRPVQSCPVNLPDRQQLSATCKRFLSPTHEAFLVGARLAVEAAALADRDPTLAAGTLSAKQVVRFVDFDLEGYLLEPGISNREAAVRCAAALPATDRALDALHSSQLLSLLRSLRSDVQQATSTSDVQRVYKVEEFLQEQLPRLLPDLDQESRSNKSGQQAAHRALPFPSMPQRLPEELLRSKSKVRGDPPVARTIRQELQSVVGLLSMLRRETAALRSLLTHGSMQLVDKGQFGVPGFLSFLRLRVSVSVFASASVTGHMELDANLLEVLDGILGNYLPSAWRRASFPCGKPLLGWAFDVRSRLQWLQTAWERLCSGSEPFCFRLDLLWRPRALLLATLRAAARVQELPLEALSFRQQVISRVEEEEDVQDHSGPLISFCALATDFKPKRRYIAVPLFQIAAALPRARGQAEDPNFIAQVFLRSANEPDEWLLKLSPSLGVIACHTFRKPCQARGGCRPAAHGEALTEVAKKEGIILRP
eukprot:s4258_g1.t1